MKKLTLVIPLALLTACIVRPTPPAQEKFYALTIKEIRVLMNEITKQQWRIGYNFTADCPLDFRQKEQELKELISKALQTWLQPLRTQYPHKKFTANFLLVRQPDAVQCAIRDHTLRELDTRVTFDCQGKGTSFAQRSAHDGKAPALCIKKRAGVAINWNFTFDIVHELGHAFGLGDTYARDLLTSSGGLAHTLGKQPASVMAAIRVDPLGNSPFHLGEDDKNGIIWLYRYLHEDHPVGDCFFPDYVREGWDGICRPKYPLIFEAKHGSLDTVQQILLDDPTLDLNARDHTGMTALHYAVQRADTKTVKALLAQANIKVNVMNKEGRTPAQLAKQLRLARLAVMIEKHPTAKRRPLPWTVEAKGKKAVTWGELKRGGR